MASAVVSSITKKLGDLLIQEALVLFEVHDDVKWIQEELESMQCFLKDADSKQRKDLQVKNWVEQIRRVSYDAEDVIDTFIYSQNAQRRKRGFAEWVARCVCIVGELLSEQITRYTVGKKIDKIKKRIIHIRNRRETFGIREIVEERQEASSWIRDLEGCRRDAVMFDEPQLVGQDKEFKTVRDQLMTKEQRRRVISIFGIGGSGKTALAQKILKDVQDHFECHALVYVSQQCNIKDVLVRIIKAVAGHSAPEGMDEVDLGLMLQNYLKGKRYLVVIDDIWTTNAWDRLILKLPDDKNRSRVLVTTRIRDVALHADPSSYHHEMRLLNDDESWELFMKKIFPGEDPSTACPSDLEGTGRKILAKCGGLPLAILVLGGLLATKEEKTIWVWSNVLDSARRHLTESSEPCMKILALSYWDLPHYLKPCFLYLGLFPEDHEIGSGKLIRLWIAEGFIQQKGDKLMEDIAEDYLKDLVGRSMIQVASKKSNGSIKKCRIHDLLRELSISEATKNNFFGVHNDNDSSGVRRMAFYPNIDGDEIRNHSTETLRSILYFLNSTVDVLKLPNKSSKLLRVINAESEVSSEVSLPREVGEFVKVFSEVSLPKEVGEFVHLKFLEVSCQNYNFHSIPPSIGNLSSLQTLKVHVEPRVILPNTIWSLKKLRHLHVHYSHIDGPPHLSNLTNLQTLHLMAGSWIKEGLGELTNLRRLGIFGDVSSYRDTLPRCIENLRNLRSLRLVGKEVPFPPLMPFTHHLDLYKLCLVGSLEKLPEMPPNLAELSLCYSNLRQDAIFTLEKLQHLKILRLYLGSYHSKQMICSPGGFPGLELLELSQLPLEKWIVKEGAMVSLKRIQLFHMSELNTGTLPERVLALLQRH